MTAQPVREKFLCLKVFNCNLFLFSRLVSCFESHSTFDGSSVAAAAAITSAAELRPARTSAILAGTTAVQRRWCALLRTRLSLGLLALQLTYRPESPGPFLRRRHSPFLPLRSIRDSRIGLYDRWRHRYACRSQDRRRRVAARGGVCGARRACVEDRPGGPPGARAVPRVPRGRAVAH